jgi:hypothetical protein
MPCGSKACGRITPFHSLPFNYFLAVVHYGELLAASGPKALLSNACGEAYHIYWCVIVFGMLSKFMCGGRWWFVMGW